jgi:UDP-N-acetylglucosamine diphosphorylase / glucose-1-phosphate thymidylyltransferase / UDP-N-acetylgalactosamine diphosphorylase / glucosamine-1-phosphate N-acetyltransferase / galactosamine-1-phosphate N-acetyltransferase
MFLIFIMKITTLPTYSIQTYQPTPMQAILLTAGQSKRFAPLGDKNFFKLGEYFLIEQQVKKIQNSGIKKIIIVANKNNYSHIQKLFPKNEIVIQKNLNHGMLGGVLSASKFLNSDTPTLITSTNDVIETSVIKKLLTKKNCNGVILAQKIDKYFPGGYIKIQNNKITSIIEKPKQNKIPSNLVNIVFHFFRKPKTLLSELKKVSNKNDDGYELALNKLFKKQNFTFLENSKQWVALKFPWHALDLTQHFLAQQKPKISKQASIAKTAIIEGNTLIHSGTRILDYAIVKNSVIGENAVIGNHSLVRDSLIQENAVIGGSSEVARSYIGNNSWLHRNYIGDSVLAKNVSLGSGCVCANLRLDDEEIFCEIQNKKIATQKNKFGCVIGKNSRVGVNTSIMPGVLVGEGSFIGSGLVVEKNISSQTFFNTLWKTKNVENKKLCNVRGKL